MDLTKFYINGAWVQPDSTREFPVLNPATEAQIGTIILGNKADVNAAVAAAKAAFESFLRTTQEERIALLERLLEISKDRCEEMAQAMSAEMGAPITMARDAQADSGIGHLEGILEALKTQELRETLPNGDILVREPIGVCGLITPWNWPINQIALKVLPALATGSTCVLKPSEHTPMSAAVYAQMIHDAGYPAGVFNLIHGDGPTVGAGLSRHPDIAMMSFTGSTRAGRRGGQGFRRYSQAGDAGAGRQVAEPGLCGCGSAGEGHQFGAGMHVQHRSELRRADPDAGRAQLL